LKKLHFLLSNSRNVHENLALEEFLVTEKQDDYVLFYINTNAVVIGKHQNPWKEVNLSKAGEHNIQLARRISGGGTVFHDIGNINFSFIRNKETDFVNFREHIEPVSAALQKLGVNNSISERNDIFVGDFKVSGNAEHVNSTKKRILHHGTLLYNANLSYLSHTCRPEIGIHIDTHAVASVPSPVANIKSHKDFGSVESFLKQLIGALKTQIGKGELEEIDPSSIEMISSLAKTKFTSWAWLKGHSPKFSWTNDLGDVIEYKRGEITAITSKEDLANQLVGQSYKKDALLTYLKSADLPLNWVDRFSIDK